MRKRTLFQYGMLTALCLALLGGCGSSEEPVDQEELSYWESQQFDDFSGSDFVKVGESGKMQLLLNPSSGTIRWLDSDTGIYQDSNMAHDETLESKSNSQQSDVIVRYFNGSTNNNKLYDSMASYDSYSMSASRGQLSYQKIDNGVRILYDLYNDDVTFHYFPPKISDERMQNLIRQYLDESQIKTLEERYSKLASGEWVRGFNTGVNADSGRIGPLAVKELYSIFYEVGAYTEDELYVDLAEWEATEANYPTTMKFKVAVEYYLDGEELVVNVDTTKLEAGKKNPISQLTLLPYFLTSDAGIDQEEGYMLLPSGSGALIYLDSTKIRESRFYGSFYGGDHLIGANVYSGVDTALSMPVFGMKNAASTIFAVIEEGAEVATLDAFVSGQDNLEPFSKLRLTFDIQSQQRIASGAKNTSGEFVLYKASDDVYDDNITIRYFWLGEDAGYVEMADCYAGYLEERGVLAKGGAEDNASFYMELLGSTDKTKYMLGIPYEGTQVLTSFSQAEEILRDMTEAGVGNIKLIYSGMVNGGMNQRSMNSGVKLVSGMGGKSGFKKLKSYAESVGAQIFPNLQLQTAYRKTKLTKEMVAWNIVNQRAQIYTFDPVGNEVEADTSFPLYIVSPNYMDTYLSKVKKSYSKNIGLDTMASGDLYTFIPTNYQDTHASLSTGEALMKVAVGAFAEDMKLMLANPASDAWAYSAYLTDIPTDSNDMKILDASVPFIQLVLDGYKTYSAESLNKESTDVYVHFMRAIESRSLPKFTFMYEDSSLLSGTQQENFFAVDYSYWKDKIGAYYEEYNTFYDRVRGAQITGHELYERNDKLRVVTYSNGVKIYFNYSDLEEQIDGVTVPAFSYVIK